MSLLQLPEPLQQPRFAHERAPPREGEESRSSLTSVHAAFQRDPPGFPALGLPVKDHGCSLGHSAREGLFLNRAKETSLPPFGFQLLETGVLVIKLNLTFIELELPERLWRHVL